MKVHYLLFLCLLLLVACGGGGEEAATPVLLATASVPTAQPTARPTLAPTHTFAAPVAAETPAPRATPTAAGAETPANGAETPANGAETPATAPEATAMPPAREDTPGPRTPMALDTPLPPTLVTPAPAPVTAVELAPVAGGFQSPVYLTHAFDERLFVVEQAGRIVVVQDGQRLEPPFLDIADRVGSQANEQGLLSLAFLPGDPTVFFVYYTDVNGDTVLARYRVSDDPNRADRDSEVVLLALDQPFANHNGGQLQFGPDGTLYVGLGDGGSAGDPQNNGQNPETLLGSLLRLDVSDTAASTYAIPPDNPYAGDAAGRDEIYAIGLRNPWRFSFDRLTEDFYLADVGQNRFEEVNFVPAGQGAGLNYGWNIMEGLHCFRDNCSEEGLYLPVVEYALEGGRCAVTGGYVYRGAQFPALAGNYFFGDYCSGEIWSLFRGADGWQQNQVASGVDGLTSFGQDAAGELYAVTRSGTIYQIRP